MERRLLAGPGRAPATRRRGPSARRRRAARDPHAQPRGQPRDVVQRLDDVGRPGRAGLVVGRVGHRDPADAVQERQEVRDGRTRVAIASRQRDCRTSAKSRIDRRSKSSYRPASWTRRSTPSPDQATHRRRGGPSHSSRSRTGCDSKGGSPGHQTVTGRSWISSGATRPNRWRPVSPPAVRKISSAHVSGASGARHHAVGLDPRVDPRRPVRVGALDDQRPRRMAAGQPADRLRAALADLGLARDDDQVHHRRPGGDVRARRHPRRPRRRRRSRGWARAQIRPARARSPRSTAPSTSSAASARPAAAARPARSARRRGRVPTAITSPDAPPRPVRRGSPSRAAPFRSGATGVPRARAGRRPPRVPRCRRRSSGTRGRATRPRCRGSGRRSTTPPRPRRRG